MKLNRLSFFSKLLLAIASGAMVIPLSYLENFDIPDIFNVSIIDFLIGAVFALFVMIPMQKSFNWLRALAMVVSSIAIYISVAQLAMNHYKLLNLNLSYEVGTIVSGGLGAIFTGLICQVLAPIKLKWVSYLWLIVFGSITGYIFSLTISSSSIFINTIGFVLWQTSVFLILNYSKK